MGEAVQSFIQPQSGGGRVLLVHVPLLDLLNPLELVLNLVLKLQNHRFYLRDLIL